ncbi:bifunctional adenosylcobinamide kinase/adenosylcobinamide-phosphate guanylyltransferase [Lihuaxuella thermophila]|uniref:Adenosylcobinamide kinase n=1 Tax=Lihuaxuella thermophila TaxID=1173111 RepID=A0A1H8AF01_9BACL|nr:bifunctional adenosylcobinamide kinase/adenosylcobinamide-phosphate guanylyltransferase [Lihuaxuella thermophila]SEM69171.1 adenosylcobinamide kinase / adenosylcobinamide-phosphate guanylyltransferase [Lihuaxuella thermophila]
MGIRLVTGGVRSGKSRFAESICTSLGREVIYIATGTAVDTEMEERIIRHREQRPAAWGLVEEPFRLPEAVAKVPGHAVLLIDSLTAWVSNRMWKANATEVWTKEQKKRFLSLMKDDMGRLLQGLQEREAVLVTDEAGWGGVSMNAVGRLFQEALGQVNQQAAEAAQEVWLVVSGIPWRIKG